MMTNETLKKHYERKYSHENNSSSIELINHVPLPSSRFEAIVKFFPDFFKGGKILELGAGNGNVAMTLLKTKLDITGYMLGDISLPRVEGLKRNLNDPRVEVLEVDAENVPKSQLGKYDAIIMVALIEHLIDPLQAMKEIKKLLKPGGFVYIDTPNIAKYTRRIKLLLGQFPSTASTNEGLTTYAGNPVDLYDEGHIHYFTHRSLSLMLTERCGFSNVIKLSYPDGMMPLGKFVHSYLAKIRPELFSDIAVIVS